MARGETGSLTLDLRPRRTAHTPQVLRVQVGYTAGVNGTKDVAVPESELPEGRDVLTIEDDGGLRRSQRRDLGMINSSSPHTSSATTTPNVIPIRSSSWNSDVVCDKRIFFHVHPGEFESR